MYYISNVIETFLKPITDKEYGPRNSTYLKQRFVYKAWKFNKLRPKPQNTSEL